MAKIEVHEAKANLSRLVERAAAGEEILLARHGQPVARLVAIPPPSSLARVRGAWRGKVKIADDFDGLPEDIADALGAR